MPGDVVADDAHRILLLHLGEVAPEAADVLPHVGELEQDFRGPGVPSSNAISAVG
jgi:hypothetical protein